MTTIIHHRVEIADHTGIIGRANEFSVTELEVIAENDRYLCVRDSYFTTIDKEPRGKYNTHAPLNKESICINTNDSVWGNRITYTLYSTKRKTAAAIRKAIEKEVQKRFGFFMSGIDLIIITDKPGSRP